MLKILRHKNVSRIALWAILILILPSFVMWGAGSMGKSGEKGPKFVGTVNGSKVSFEDFSKSLTSTRCQIILNYFNNTKVLDELLGSKQLLGKVAWDRLIMSREAKKLKIKITDAEVIAYLRSHPMFSRGGTFDSGMYAYILRNNLGMDARTFEEMVRENLAMQKLNEMQTKDVKATDEETLAFYKADNGKFKISYALLSLGEPTAETFEKYKQFSELTTKGNKNFEEAVAAIGSKTQETPLFSKSDSIEGLGEALGLAGEAAGMKTGDISQPLRTKGGVVVFKLLSSQEADSANFEKEKAEYSKKVLELKKNMRLEEWIKGLEDANTLNIDLADYEKYYR